MEQLLTNVARDLMELPLRTLILVSQYDAGMWQGNYELAKQIDRYRYST